VSKYILKSRLFFLTSVYPDMIVQLLYYWFVYVKFIKTWSSFFSWV